MFGMQRITWSGVALHQGVVPNYPASHGCVRLPEAFARQLWTTTRLGARVIIASNDVQPVEIANPRLFTAKQNAAFDPAESRAAVADDPVMTDITERPKINPRRIAYFGDNLPVSTLVEVKGLVDPRMKVEIECQAYVE